jgi:calpain-15
LWAALVEKAYAKAHGSYAQLSGGFIAEGLADLTGAPCETILFTMVDRELLWARLLSFVQAGFGMGVATSGRTTTKGSGLVGGHAYSVLDVRQLDDVVVGAQAKVTDFFGASLGKASTAAGLSSSAAAALTTSYTTSTTVRLVQIRNPWGSKEWKGDWSAQSVQWTQKLRQRLPDSWRQGDGTFFMSFEDMLQNFHHMDVCKTQEGWQHTSAMGTWQSGMREPLQSSRRCYRLRPLFQASYAYVSIIQPKKRANTQSHFWYTDNSLVLLQRRIGTDREEAWSTAACSLSGVQRSTTLEVFLDPQKYEYICLSYACSPQSHHTPFRVTVYSGQKVQIEETPLEEAYARAALEVIHKHLLKVEHKLIYPLCQGCILVCSQQSNGCYFVALNATDYHVSLRLTVEAPKDIHVVYRGARDDTHDIPAGCQRILLVLSGSGKSSMTATQCPFRYASAVEQRRPSPSTAPMVSGAQLPAPSTSLGGSIGLTMAGELLATQAASHVALEGCRGQDSLDTFAWIPQLGAAATSGC